ncbi:MAG: hypothetical protein HFE83_10900 [Lachnospiraceae bacterium]|nr:hypothetical protein [Lachnospiraceae bacterium]
MRNEERIPDGVTRLAGGYELEAAPMEPFAPVVMDFLSRLSDEIRAIPRREASEEMKALGFWLRRAHLLELRRAYGRENALGLGIVFHIAPANVPLLFAYSCAIGLLAGNACRVRVSGRRNTDCERLCSLIGELLSEEGFLFIRRRISILSYDRAFTDLTRQFSLECDARVIWGGDRTVEEIRAIPLRPQAMELAFPDRTSLCVMNPEALLALSDEALTNLAIRFYNDTYGMDQNACSCPKLVCWQTAEEARREHASKRFWDAVAEASKRYALSEIKVSQKYGALWERVGLDADIRQIRRWSNRLYVLELGAVSEGFSESRMQFGSFLEYHMKQNDEWTGAVSEKVQTLTFFGVERDCLLKTVREKRLRGIQRIVPVGQALFMDLTWDGKDLIACLSRTIG